MIFKICLWSVIACSIVIGIYWTVTTFGLIDVLIYSSVVLLAVPIAIWEVYVRRKREASDKQLPAGYVIPTRTKWPMDAAHGYGTSRSDRRLRLIATLTLIPLFIGLALVVIINSGEMQQLEKPLRRTRIQRVRSVKGDVNSDEVVCELWLCTQDRRREYRLIDSPSDGYFPDDADGLVDSVSSRAFSYTRKERSEWHPRPFEKVLYEVLTDKYIKAIAERTYRGTAIERKRTDPEKYRYITRRDRKKYKTIIIVLSVFAAVFVVLDYVRRKCPACGRNWGLKRTGNRHNLNKGIVGRFRLPTHPDYTYEYRCKACGHNEWIRFSLNPYDRT